jgi:type IV fimbrial biogenesis protein FimT
MNPMTASEPLNPPCETATRSTMTTTPAWLRSASRPATCRGIRGFTLLELMVTLGVLGILTTIAYPSMRDFMLRNRAVAQSNSIRSDLQYARGEAAATRSYVSICPLASSSSSGLATCDTGKNYDQGWLLYTASKPNEKYDAAVAGSLQRSVAAPAGVSIRAGSAGPLTFNSRGELLVGSVPTSTSMIVCAKSGDSDGIGESSTAVPGIRLDITSSGRASSTKLAAGAACSIAGP